jgi:predicted ATPase
VITKVRLEYFKRFRGEAFELDDHVVLAGPNNSGKSTLLQALAVWGLVLQRWRAARGTEDSRATVRTGIPLSRKDFTAIPLRDMSLLWADRSTAYRKEDQTEARKPGYPKVLAVAVEGTDDGGAVWQATASIRYNSREQAYIRMTNAQGDSLTELPQHLEGMQVVHVPPFSGIGAEETRYDRGYQNLLVGQGKPGDILRNLLFEVHSSHPQEWEELRGHVKGLFGCDLRDPVYSSADPYIVVEYADSHGNGSALDVASAGSGFHQVLMLLGFIYARPASVLLLDEPDAHEHVILQRQVHDLLRTVAREHHCQLLVATHSPVLLDETPPERILSFYARPHRLRVDTERDQVREALKLLPALDVLQCEAGANVLYAEDESDLKILREFAGVLAHAAHSRLARPFFHPLRGRDARLARNHFFALKAVHRGVRGVVLLDGDNRSLPDREVTAEGLTVLRWRRYEIENYLLHPEALLRSVSASALPLFDEAARRRAREFMENEVPPAALREPLGDHEFLVSIPASKTFLPGLFRAAGTGLPKAEYYQIAARMKPEEIPPEVTEVLDALLPVLGPAPASG